MASDNIERKARRLLTEGKIEVLRVRPKTGLVVAECEGDHDVYKLGYDPEGSPYRWRCTCPYHGFCAHLVALRLVCGNGRFAPTTRPDPLDDARLVAGVLPSGVGDDVYAALDRLAGRR